MAKINCPKAKEAFVKANIAKFLGLNKGTCRQNIKFSNIMQGAYEVGLITPKRIANKFGINVVDARNLTREARGQNPRQQKKIARFIAQVNGIN